MSSTSSPRPPRLPRAERRAQLLEAAHGIFAERGYHSTAMDAIAEAAQVSKPVLYQHFPGKRELYLALLDSELQGLSARLVTAVSETQDNRERVNATVRLFFEYVAQDSGAHRLVFHSDVAHDTDVAERLAAFEATVGSAIGSIIAAQAGLPRASSDLLGHALAGAARTAAMRWSEEREVPLTEAAALVARLAWRGLGQFPRESA